MTTHPTSRRKHDAAAESSHGSRELLELLVQASTEFVGKLFGARLAKGLRKKQRGSYRAKRLSGVVPGGEPLEARQLLSVSLGAMPSDAPETTALFAASFGQSKIQGDANGDGVVGAADYALWAAQFGRRDVGLSADFDENSDVGLGDYVLWAANFRDSLLNQDPIPLPILPVDPAKATDLERLLATDDVTDQLLPGNGLYLPREDTKIVEQVDRSDFSFLGSDLVTPRWQYGDGPRYKVPGIGELYVFGYDGTTMGQENGAYVAKTRGNAISDGPGFRYADGISRLTELVITAGPAGGTLRSRTTFESSDSMTGLQPGTHTYRLPAMLFAATSADIAQIRFESVGIVRNVEVKSLVYDEVDDHTFAAAVSQELWMVNSVSDWTLDDGYGFDARIVAPTFNFSAFNTNAVPIPQAQNYGGGPRTTIEGVGIVEAYSSELGLTIDAYGALTATRSGGIGDAVGFALRDDSALRLAPNVEWAGPTSTVLQYGFNGQPTLGEIVVQPGLHTYEIPRKAQWWQIQTPDGRLVRFVDFKIIDAPDDAPPRNRRRELDEHGKRLSDVSGALAFLTTQVSTQQSAGSLPPSLAHLPEALAEATTTLADATASYDRATTEFNSFPWESLTSSSSASLFPATGHEKDLAISVIYSEGPAIALAVGNPGSAPIYADMERGVPLLNGREPQYYPAGGGMAVFHSAIDQSAPSGSYLLRVYSADGTTIGTTTLHWDQGLQSFQFDAGPPPFEPTIYDQDDGHTPFAQMIQNAVIGQTETLAVATEEADRARIAFATEHAFLPIGAWTRDINLNEEARQRIRLYDLVHSYFTDIHQVTPQDLDDVFWVEYPQWRQENQEAVKEANHWGTYTWLASREGDHERMRVAAGYYNDGLLALISTTLDAIAAAFQGDSALATQLMQQVTVESAPGRSPLSYVGIEYPSAGRLLAACAATFVASPEGVADSYDQAIRDFNTRIENDFWRDTRDHSQPPTRSPDEQAILDRQRQDNFNSLLSTVSYMATQGLSVIPTLEALRDGYPDAWLSAVNSLNSSLTPAAVDVVLRDLATVEVSTANADDLPDSPEPDGIGGALNDARNSITQHAAFDTVQQWANNWARHDLINNQHYVSGDSYVGAIYLQIFHGFWTTNTEQRATLLATAEAVTGVDLSPALRAASSGQYQRWIDALDLAFRNAGYKYIFADSKDAVLTQGFVLTDKPVYTADTMRVTWDLPSRSDKQSHAEISIVAHYGRNQTVWVLAPSATDALFADIPISRFAASIQGYPAVDGNRYPLKVAVFFQASSPLGVTMHSATDIPQVFALQALDNPAPGDGLSTLPMGDPNKPIEDAILQQLKASADRGQFLYPDISTWTWTFASSLHDDEAENAVDLNHYDSSWAPDDARVSVLLPFAGRPVLNRLDSQGYNTSILVFEHAFTFQGTTVYFYTKYLHMVSQDGRVGPLIDGVIRPWAVGQSVPEVAAGTAIGLTAHEGLGSGDHLHFELMVGPNGARLSEAGFFGTHSTDLRQLLVPLGLRVTAAAGYYDTEANEFVDFGPGNLVVRWDPDVQSWVSDKYHLIYDRTEQSRAPGFKSYWLAYSADEGHRWRVKWDGGKFLKMTDDLQSDPDWRWYFDAETPHFDQ